jgi:amino acid permease
MRSEQTDGVPQSRASTLVEIQKSQKRERAMKRHITTLCVGGVLALALFGVAAAESLEEGGAALNQGD